MRAYRCEAAEICMAGTSELPPTPHPNRCRHRVLHAELVRVNQSCLSGCAHKDAICLFTFQHKGPSASIRCKEVPDES
jgi:hypothetical protein